MKKEAPLNVRGSLKRPPIKRGTPKCKGLIKKTSNEKRCTPKCKRLIKKISTKKCTHK
jgi:hypothetical protein